MIVDDLSFTFERTYNKEFISTVDAKFEFETVLGYSGVLKFYGVTIEQYDFISIAIHGDKKI